jgi:hypothetical protein
MNTNEQQRVSSLQSVADSEYNEGWAAFNAGMPLDAGRPKAWQEGWSDNETNTAANEEDLYIEGRAYHKVKRLAKYGSRRTKVLIRKSSGYTLPGVVAIIRAARA